VGCLRRGTAWAAEGVFMGTVGELILRVQPAPDGDDDELAELTRRLRVQLLGLDVDSVDPMADSTDSGGAKGLEP
jgi:hypothetical protein